jgi:glycosyltransferase involved in cell wall biosynthesis
MHPIDKTYTNPPLISVIVISYNAENFIIETLESIKSQTYRNVELIISDDASKDRTIEVCENWLQENSSYFKDVFIDKGIENKGIPANINKGVKLSSGEFIKIIAADDILLNDCLERNMEIVQDRGVDLVYSNMIFFSDRDQVLPGGKNYFLEYFSTLYSEDQLKLYCRTSVFLNTPTWFTRRSIIESTNGFDESYRLLEDQVFLIKAIELKAKIVYLDAVTVKYRIHQKSVANTISNQFVSELTKAFKEIKLKHLSFSNPKDLANMLEFKLWEINHKSSSSKVAIILAKIIGKFSLARYSTIFLKNAENTGFKRSLKYLIS